MSQRTKFLLLVGLFMLPTAASFIVFYFFPPEKSGNYGELVSPVIQLPAPGAVRFSPSPTDTGDGLRGKWLLITRDSGACGAACRTKLFAMRQARLILGRDQDRVVLVILVDDEVVPAASLQKEFDGTVWLAAKSSPWLNILPLPAGATGRNARGHIYAADPLGNLFMRYAAEPDIKRLSRDLQRVLKASQIG